MKTGFFGKVLWVNLTKEIFQEKLIDKDIYQNYLGGYGLAVKIIYESLKCFDYTKNINHCCNPVKEIGP